MGQVLEQPDDGGAARLSTARIYERRRRRLIQLRQIPLQPTLLLAPELVPPERVVNVHPVRNVDEWQAGGRRQREAQGARRADRGSLLRGTRAP